MYQCYFVNTPTEEDDEACLGFSNLREAQAASKLHGHPVTDRMGKEVKLFSITQRQSHFETFEIEASSEKEALEILKNGYKKPVYECWGEEYFYETQQISATE